MSNLPLTMVVGGEIKSSYSYWWKLGMCPVTFFDLNSMSSKTALIRCDSKHKVMPVQLDSFRLLTFSSIQTSSCANIFSLNLLSKKDTNRLPWVLATLRTTDAMKYTISFIAILGPTKNTLTKIKITMCDLCHPDVRIKYATQATTDVKYIDWKFLFLATCVLV